MTLIVVVAIMNISSSMIMLVMENEQDIGILKSMGMSNSFLSFQYILTAGLAGAGGSIIGIGTGTLIAMRFNLIINLAERMINAFLNLFYRIFNIVSPGDISLLNSEYYLDSFNINIDSGVLLIIFVLTTLLSMVAALIPIRNISKIIPLDILRKH
jgi:lipoprotein-releasing system permease protein